MRYNREYVVNLVEEEMNEVVELHDGAYTSLD